MINVDGRAPFPIIPPAVQIFSLLGAVYPHFDLVDDKLIFRTGRLHIEQSLYATSLGCCVLLLGFYSCLFVTSLRPLWKEYLGNLGLIQTIHLALLVARAVSYPDSLTSDPVGTAVSALTTVGVAILVLSDHLTAPARTTSKEAPPNQKTVARVQRIVGATTHALWFLFAVQFVLPHLIPGIWGGEAPPAHKPYGSLATVLVLLVAMARLGAYMAERVAAGRAIKEKDE